MSVLGVGTDIIEIERIKTAIERTDSFKKRVFTDKEIAYAEKANSPYFIFAGRFAAKEAISKAFGTGFRGFNLTDIEVVNDELGKPEVVLKNNLKEKYEGYNILLSISHNRESAVATAILTK